MNDHIPVLLEEVVAGLCPADGEVFVDCTLGRGGHSEELLAAADCKVIGLDRDPEAVDASSRRLEVYGSRFSGYHAPFSALESVLETAGLSSVDGVLADLGVSSPQLDEPGRGFSFRQSGPVDMRMDPTASLDAATIVNTWEQVDLARILKEFGEEPRARAVAAAIVAGRPWADTRTLAAAVARVAGPTRKIHRATKTFQALRIVVNDELGELRRLLPASLRVLGSGGRLAVIAFHSLEDRIVKQFIALESGRTGPRDVFGHPTVAPRLDRPAGLIKAGLEESNPRARSARLRIATRLTWD